MARRPGSLQLLALSNQASGCDVTYSFDRKLARHAAVTLATWHQIGGL